MIEVLRPNGAVVGMDPSPRAFPTAAAAKPRRSLPVDPQEFLEERHHHYYGRPWVTGRYYFDQLRANGLKRRHKVLDLGCGAGRVGVWLAAYLAKGRYCGLDAHLRALQAFAAYECVLHGLEAKRPRLLFTDGFEVEAFGERFDVALDFYLTPHLAEDRAQEALARTAAVCRPGARLFSLTPPLPPKKMADIGFELRRSWRVEYPLLHQAGAKGGDEWRLYIRRR